MEPNRLVKKGELLFRIDPTPYQNDLNVAKAKLAADEAKFAVTTNPEVMTRFVPASVPDRSPLQWSKCQPASLLAERRTVSPGEKVLWLGLRLTWP